MLLDLTPDASTAHFMALDDVRDARTAQSALAAFRVDAGVARVRGA